MRDAYGEFWSRAYDEGEREMDETMCKCVSTLNTWTDDKKAKAREILEEGYWLLFDSTCMGHSLAERVSLDGIKWAFEEYGFNLQLAQRKGTTDFYVRLR